MCAKSYLAKSGQSWYVHSHPWNQVSNLSIRWLKNRSNLFIASYCLYADVGTNITVQLVHLVHFQLLRLQSVLPRPYATCQTLHAPSSAAVQGPRMTWVKCCKKPFEATMVCPVLPELMGQAVAMGCHLLSIYPQRLRADPMPGVALCGANAACVVPHVRR